MTKDMSTMTTENLKSYIVADRMTVLNAIAKACASVINNIFPLIKNL